MIDISDICQTHNIMSEKCQHYYSEENKICIWKLDTIKIHLTSANKYSDKWYLTVRLILYTFHTWPFTRQLIHTIVRHNSDTDQINQSSSVHIANAKDIRVKRIANKMTMEGSQDQCWTQYKSLNVWLYQLVARCSPC